MNRNIVLGLAVLAGAALGAAAVQTLHAQAKPMAYVIAENIVNDEAGYTVPADLPAWSAGFTAHLRET